VPALQAAGTDDGTAGPGGHPVSETVVLCPPADMWLVSALQFPLVPGPVLVDSLAGASRLAGEKAPAPSFDPMRADATLHATRPVRLPPGSGAGSWRVSKVPGPTFAWVLPTSTWPPNATSSVLRPGVPCVKPGPTRHRRGGSGWGPTSPGPPQTPSKSGGDELPSNPHLWISLWTYLLTGGRSPR